MEENLYQEDNVHSADKK